MGTRIELNVKLYYDVPANEQPDVSTILSRFTDNLRPEFDIWRLSVKTREFVTFPIVPRRTPPLPLLGTKLMPIVVSEADVANMTPTRIAEFAHLHAVEVKEGAHERCVKNRWGACEVMPNDVSQDTDHPTSS